MGTRTHAPNSGSFSDLLSLSERMLESAGRGDWDEVQALEARRRPLVEACFSLRETPPDAAGMAEQMRRIIDLDRRLMAIAGRAREKAGAALGSMHRGRLATEVYGRVGR